MTLPPFHVDYLCEMSMKRTISEWHDTLRLK